MINSFQTYPDCVFLIDKSPEWTSFDVVNKIRRVLKVKKVGHAGTLDPAATGLLILCSGKNTKKIDTFQSQTKVYSGKIQFGFTTPSYDSETEQTKISETNHLKLEDIILASKAFIGEIEQIPPMYSALKVGGKKLYELARKGKEIERASRKVTIFDFKILSFDHGVSEFTVTCSKGTYIRSLANDLGEKLKVGGYLASLRREKIGEFDVKDAWTVDQFIDNFSQYLKEQDKLSNESEIVLS